MSNLIDLIQKASSAAGGLNPADLAGLVQMQDHLVLLSQEGASAERLDIAALVDHCVKLIEGIIFREVDSVDRTIETIQNELNTLARRFEQSDGTQRSTAEPADESLVQDWLVDCRESLADLENLLVALDEQEDPSAALAEIRRRIHTLKGECGILSLGTAQALCHEAETAIDRGMERDDRIPVDELLALLDWMRLYAAALAEDAAVAPPEADPLLERFRQFGADAAATLPAPAAEAPPVTATVTTSQGDVTVVSFGRVEMDENLRDFITEAHEHLDHAEQSLLALEQDFTDREHINTIFRAFHTVKGVAGFLNLKPIVMLAHHAEALLDKARTGTVTLDSSSLDLILFSCDFLARLLGTLEGEVAPRQATLEELIHLLERATAGERPNAPTREKSAPAKEAAGSSGAPNRETTPAESSDEKAESGKRAGGRWGEQSVKVNTTRLDTLVNMVGELVIAQQMIVQDARVRTIDDQKTQRNLTHVGKIIRDLQEVAMSLRMVAVKGTFQKMARLVRDLASKSGKKIAFEMDGEDTELDRTVVEEIGDPLVHMIRNACDHGLETPEERRATGKPEIGRVVLRAYHQGGSIMIEIADDGRGLDRAKILAKAIKQGILPTDRAPEDMTDGEVYQLIFAAGFSTAEKVTDISGRGVGMDVVRRNIEALRGKIEIESVLGRGTTFKMLLPLTMAIIDGMVVRVGCQRYVVPTLSIERAFRPAPGMIHTVVGRGEMVSVRDSLLPVHRLKRVFTLINGLDEPTDGLLLVLEANDTRCCMLVDEIVGQQQVVIKSLGRGVRSMRGVSGGAILGDGRVALILDVAGIVQQATAGERIPSSRSMLQHELS